MQRVRQGVYANTDVPADLARAARVGGRLAGVSAAGALGLWTPPRHPLVVEVPAKAGRLRDPDDTRLRLRTGTADVRVLWHSLPPGVAPYGIPPLPEVLRQVVLTEPSEFAVAVLDSAIRRTGLDLFDLELIAAALPRSRRGAVRRATGIPESGTESVLGDLLRQAGVAARPQVPIPFTDLDRLDFLVGDRLVLECDSEANHGGRAQRLRDLRRDAQLACLGFIVLRFDYEQVFFDRETVVAAVLAYVERGLHLDRR